MDKSPFTFEKVFDIENIDDKEKVLLLKSSTGKHIFINLQDNELIEIFLKINNE